MSQTYTLRTHQALWGGCPAVLTPGHYTHHTRCPHLIRMLQRVVDVDVACECFLAMWMPGQCSGTTPIPVPKGWAFLDGCCYSLGHWSPFSHPKRTVGYCMCAPEAVNTKRRKQIGSSVAYKATGTFLSQRIRHEDTSGPTPKVWGTSSPPPSPPPPGPFQFSTSPA